MNYELLRMLADGEFHSGVALGARLNLTRAAIWKNIAQLEAAGIGVESVKGRGYRLSDPINMLEKVVDREKMAKGCGFALRDFLVLDSVDSTNTHLKEYSRDLPMGCFDVCVSEEQTGGRGRRGREWISPFAKNLYVSISCRLPGGFSSLSGLSLGLGAATAESIKQVAQVDVGLKWPNDVWIQDKKVAGILVDVEGENNGPVLVVAGIGINVFMSDGEGGEIGQPWTTLEKESHVTLDRNVLLLSLINTVMLTIGRFVEGGFGSIRQYWDKYDCLVGKAVTLHGFQAPIEGVYKGVDGGGNMIMDVSGGEKVYSAGEISVRLS
ncbi:biotin--[acetyl-CoA-carboxylase] ligase [Hahella sp. CCB-MM4]|uniref:biotin--[acetyl-CoA-carboxylase] ligase n=1 Tax=Hahella sp. (strain CCB-MM4) TaxID=1926491 RepID=UPI000B9AC23C|nr:biotin--[acetyl-CoA-carboxylase] ligase [Hahella sp. CCB-MM4]OZG70928.1 biotin--[acetyl-CoA-carboxylase] ligase [Hahella sp. CCB-MM4]